MKKYLSVLAGRETVLGQNLLSGGRENELGKALSRRRRAGDHGQAVIGTNCQPFSQFYDLLFGILLLCLADSSAVSKKNVSAAFTDVPAVSVAAGGRLDASGIAGELQRLFFQYGPRTGFHRFCLGKDFESIIARRIGLWRRRAELGYRIEHPVEQGRAVDLEPGLDQRAQPITSEQ